MEANHYESSNSGSELEDDFYYEEKYNIDDMDNIDNVDNVDNIGDMGDIERLIRDDELYCELNPTSTSQRKYYDEELSEAETDGEKVFYPPPRPTPLVDFFTVFSAFLMALVAVYYTIK